MALALWFLLPMTLLAATLAAQGGTRTQPAFLMLRNGTDARRGPVEGAVGLILADPVRRYPALARLGDVELFFTREQPAIPGGPSRRTGSLQFGIGGGAPPRPGAVLVLGDGDDGGHLAAFYDRLLPGAADKLMLRAAGVVVAPNRNDGGQITVYAARQTPTGEQILPALRGSAVPLPAGRYSAWIEHDGRILWRALELAAGQSIELTAADFAGDGRTLAREPGRTVTPAGRADVVLLGEERARCVLVGRAANATLQAHEPMTGRLITAREPTFAADPELLQLSVTGAGKATHGFVLKGDASGDWRVLGAATVAGGKLTLPSTPVGAGDVWLLVTSAERPPVARPMIDFQGENAATTIEFAEGQQLRATCRLPGGDPARDVHLEYVPDGNALATVAVRTDRRGRADFGAITLPGTVRASDPAFGNADWPIKEAPSAGIDLEIQPGFEVQGEVRLPNGEPVAGVTVTLTAPHDELRPGTRATVTDATGRFTFSGLTESHAYALFATTRRDGRTWSSHIGRFLAGPGDLVMTIENEDPVLGPGR